jgi:DNA (cytosine-5)-methyltransferase 1
MRGCSWTHEDESRPRPCRTGRRDLYAAFASGRQRCRFAIVLVRQSTAETEKIGAHLPAALAGLDVAKRPRISHSQPDYNYPTAAVCSGTLSALARRIREMSYGIDESDSARRREDVFSLRNVQDEFITIFCGTDAQARRRILLSLLLSFDVPWASVRPCGKRSRRPGARGRNLLLSLFCGAGGLDLGFERADFEIGLAFDKKLDSVKSYNHNREEPGHAHCVNVNDITLNSLDKLWGRRFEPEGIIGGPPCQSFSQANRSITDADPRHQLPLTYARLLKELNARKPVKFFVMENVKGLRSGLHAHRLILFKKALADAGFHVSEQLLNAADYGTPQKRERLFIVGVNEALFGASAWSGPIKAPVALRNPTVGSVLKDLPEPVHFVRDADPAKFPHHRNHWCMAPKSPRFTNGGLSAGNSSHRSFKSLAWDKPSITVAYGHREVHVHPDCHRRLSVYEAMRLQGFPHEYELIGSLSSQIDQVSEAVPPPMAEAVAQSIMALVLQLEERAAA